MIRVYPLSLLQAFTTTLAALGRAHARRSEVTTPTGEQNGGSDG